MYNNSPEGCICSTPLETLDLNTLLKIYNGELKPLKVDYTEVPGKLPFSRKIVKFVELQYMNINKKSMDEEK